MFDGRWWSITDYRPFKQYKQQKFNHFNWILCMNGFLSLLVEIELSQNIYGGERYRCNYIVIVKMKWEHRMFRDRTFFCIAKNEWTLNIRAVEGRKEEKTQHQNKWGTFLDFFPCSFWKSKSLFLLNGEYNWVLSRILLCMTVEM